MRNSITVCNHDPIDLRKKFGHRWQVSLDAAAFGRWSDPWLFQIDCRNGHLFPVGGDLLGAATNSPGTVVRRLKAIPRVVLVCDGCDGANVEFPVAVLKQVARVMRPKSKRKLSASHLEKLQAGRIAKKAYCQTAVGLTGSPSGSDA